MTPAAVTPAARSRPRTAPSSSAAPAARPRPVRARVAPAAPRRVSGPQRPLPARPARTSSASLPTRAAQFVRSLPDHPLLDRLVRGRAWIPVLGVMLAGIVAMQVEVLKLNANMGRSIALASSLQTRNELLRTSVSQLSNAHRIERLAAKMGMVMAGPTAVDFLHGRTNASRAAAAIHAPNATEFDSSLQASALQATAATTAVTASSAPTSSASAQASSTATTSAVAGSTGATGVTGAAGATTTTPSTTSATTNTGGAAPSG